MVTLGYRTDPGYTNTFTWNFRLVLGFVPLVDLLMSKIGFGTPDATNTIVTRSRGGRCVEEPEGQSAERDPEVPRYTHGPPAEGSTYE